MDVNESSDKTESVDTLPCWRGCPTQGSERRHQYPCEFDGRVDCIVVYPSGQEIP